jgi:hypothetical protein
MDAAEYEQLVKDEIVIRKKLREEKNPCPVCLQPGVIPLGGGKTCWWECACGAYSPMCKSWEEALKAPDWPVIDPEDNARMYPPVGGM